MVMLYTLVDIIFGQYVCVIKYSTYIGVGETDENRYDVIFIMVIFLKCRVGLVMISPRMQSLNLKCRMGRIMISPQK